MQYDITFTNCQNFLLRSILFDMFQIRNGRNCQELGKISSSIKYQVSGSSMPGNIQIYLSWFGKVCLQSLLGCVFFVGFNHWPYFLDYTLLSII